MVRAMSFRTVTENDNVPQDRKRLMGNILDKFGRRSQRFEKKRRRTALYPDSKAHIERRPPCSFRERLSFAVFVRAGAGSAEVRQLA